MRTRSVVIWYFPKEPRVFFNTPEGICPTRDDRSSKHGDKWNWNGRDISLVYFHCSWCLSIYDVSNLSLCDLIPTLAGENSHGHRGFRIVNGGCHLLSSRPEDMTSNPQVNILPFSICARLEQDSVGFRCRVGQAWLFGVVGLPQQNCQGSQGCPRFVQRIWRFRDGNHPVSRYIYSWEMLMRFGAHPSSVKSDVLSISRNRVWACDEKKNE